MARIAGVNIPTNKRVVIALQYIHGIGPKKANEIMGKVGIPDERRVSQLTDQEVLQIREVIDRDYMVEGDLRRDVAMNIKRRPARARATYPHQRPYTQGSGQADCGQEEVSCRELECHARSRRQLLSCHSRTGDRPCGRGAAPIED